jgi:hypothetical protein
MASHEDAAAALDTTISHVANRLATTLSFADEKPESAAVVVALIRIMVDHAKAISLLTSGRLGETANAQVRSMMEAWIEIVAVLDGPDPEENARRSVVFGLLEFGDHGRQTGHLDEEDYAQLDAKLRPYRENHSELVADVEAQRSGKDKKRSRLYWTGVSRSELLKRMEERGPAAHLRSIYKLLSWDAHHVIAAALQSSVTTDANGVINVGYHALGLEEDGAVFTRYLAVQILGHAWVHVAQHLAVDAG